MTITEICSLPVIAGTDITKSSSTGTEAFESALEVIRRQDGCEAVWAGQVRERPNQVDLYINWDKLESHNKFKETSDYPVMHKHFGAVVEGPASMLHAELTPAAKQRAVFSAPCTEIVRFYRTSESEAYVSSVNEFAEHATKQADGWMGSVGGWAVEDVEHAKFGGDGKTTGKVYWLAIAWQSYEAHMAFRDTEEFKKILPLLTSDKDVVDIDMCHIALRPY